MSLYTKIIDIQKLKEAWGRVKKNKPASGIDNVTFDQFDELQDMEIKKLNNELVDHTYRCLPVKVVTIYKGEKAREIALYSMRDKVVQQSLAIELNKVFDSHLSDGTIAYRNDKSALNAVEMINENIANGGYQYYLKADISHYFDSIMWDKLSRKIREFIVEEDVMELIKQNSCSRYLDMTDGEIIEKKCGIFQGSGISPILSNIYLMDVDKDMYSRDVFYLRYSDDLIVMGKDKDQIVSLMSELVNDFTRLGLSLNEKKTFIGEISTGFDFLGYHFDSSGKSIPTKAEDNLEERLETMWLTSGEHEISEKCKKVLEIVGGWQQYFRDDRKPRSIYEYVALIFAGVSSEYMDKLELVRYELVNYSKDIAVYLAEFWRENENQILELLEYEQLFQLGMSDYLHINDVALLNELLIQYSKFVISEDREIALEIMQIYSDLKEYSIAERWQTKCDELEKIENTNSKYMDICPAVQGMDEGIIFDKDTLSKFIQTFVGREDVYCKESINYNKKRSFSPQMIPVTEKEIEKHLKGNVTLDTYIQRQNSTVRHIIYDIDISKRILLKYANDTEEYKEYMRLAVVKANEVVERLRRFGIGAYVELSGNRGFHIWIFLTEWIPVRYAVMFNEIVLDGLYNDNDDITIECFPNKTRVKPGKLGQVMKLPYGLHIKTEERSYFIDENGNPYRDINHFIDGIAKYSLGAIKKVIATQSGAKQIIEKKDVDDDLTAFGNIAPSIREVLDKCNLMRYLCQKAVKTSYLTHFERLSVLYVFGHLGDEGKDFVHKIMSFTINYQYNVTDKFIKRMPEKPISCIKLREDYKKITAEIGCSCTFKRTKNCYPSPVIHAIALSSDVGNVTLPTSRSITKEKEKTVIGEINIHVKSQEIASKILEFKKQKRGLDKNIKKLEKELEDIFDSAKIDFLEIELGLLKRRRVEEGFEWVIEI